MSHVVGLTERNRLAFNKVTLKFLMLPSQKLPYNNFGFIKCSLKSANVTQCHTFWSVNSFLVQVVHPTWSNLCLMCPTSLRQEIVYFLSATITPSKDDAPPDSKSLGIDCSCSQR